MKYANLKLPPEVLTGLKGISHAKGFKSMIAYLADHVAKNGGDDEGMVFLLSLPTPPPGTHVILTDGRDFVFNNTGDWVEVTE